MFARYRLERLVGRGGMGMVWKAHDCRLERPVALKFLSEVCFLDAAARDELKRETRRSLDLTHPHIVRIHDFVEDQEAAAISMEYVDGATLSHLRVERENRCFDCDDLHAWTASICQALEYAHHHASCVHRDLKPSNLMVTSRGVLKVADFGIACGLQNTAARVSAWSSTGGTLGYMSPQQLRGELAAPSDDLYSLGVTLFELLTSKPPFYSGDLSLQIRDQKPPSLAEHRAALGISGGAIDPRWEETITALLAKRPEDRPRDAREVAQRLGLDLGNPPAPRPIESLPPTVVHRREPPEPAAISDISAPVSGSQREFGSIEKWLRAHPQTVVMASALLIFGAWTQMHRPATVVPVMVQTPSESTTPVVPPEPMTAVAPEPIPTPSTPAPSPTAPAAPPAVSTAGAPSSSAASTTENRPAPEGIPALLEIITTPPGIPFRLLRQAYETPEPPAPDHRGVTPALVEDLPAGAYRIVFAADGLGERSLAVQVDSSGLTRFEQTFPHGTLEVSSQPSGAEVFCDGKSIGTAPLEVSLLLGAHEVYAVHGGRKARIRKVSITADEDEKLNFDFRTGTSSATRSRTKRPKKPEDSTFTKVTRTIGKFFGVDPKKKK